MNIAIIGGGFYGCHLAKKISELGHEIELYEKKDSLLTEAISNNQHRLHLGYHYPKCSFTIEQAIRSYKLFLKEYEKNTIVIKNNYYLLHKNSNINFEEYKKVYKQYNLNYSLVDKNNLNFLSNPKDIDGIVKVDERTINLNSLINDVKNNIYNCNNINIILNSLVEQVTDDSTVITNRSNKKYDFVINCSYVNPNLGLNKLKFDTKSELCFLLLLKINSPSYNDIALTVMDGQHASLYPADRYGTHTLSSVTHTNFFQEKYLHNLQKITINQQILTDVYNKILNHSREYFKIDDLEFIRYYISYKTKILNDYNFYRGSFYIRENNNISIMCGKISAVFDLQEKILEEIKK